MDRKINKSMHFPYISMSQQFDFVKFFDFSTKRRMKEEKQERIRVHPKK